MADYDKRAKTAEDNGSERIAMHYVKKCEDLEERIKELEAGQLDFAKETTRILKAKIQRIKELEAAEKKLRALEAVGVDNWQGYDMAMDMLEG